MASMSAVRCKEPYGRGASSAAAGAAAVALPLSDGSHAIAKSPQRQQKIRIVHIFAPEIIKTEAHNFRALVQRLTGKPQLVPRRSQQLLRRTATNDNGKKHQQRREAATARPPRHDVDEAERDPAEAGADDGGISRTEEIKIEPWTEGEEEDAGEDVTRMIRSSSNSSSNSSSISNSGGFLEGLGDLELGSFFNGYVDLQWPQLLSMASSSSRLDV